MVVPAVFVFQIFDRNKKQILSWKVFFCANPRGILANRHGFDRVIWIQQAKKIRFVTYQSKGN